MLTYICKTCSDVLAHGHDGQLPGGPTSIGEKKLPTKAELNAVLHRSVVTVLYAPGQNSAPGHLPTQPLTGIKM
jgi:hypothetical protein